MAITYFNLFIVVFPQNWAITSKNFIKFGMYYADCVSMFLAQAPKGLIVHGPMNRSIINFYDLSQLWMNI